MPAAAVEESSGGAGEAAAGEGEAEEAALVARGGAEAGDAGDAGDSPPAAAATGAAGAAEAEGAALVARRAARAPPTAARTPWLALARDGAVARALGLYAALGLVALTGQELLPLLLVLPAREGGFDFDSSALGVVALACGLPLLVTQACLFAPLVARAGVVAVLAASLAAFGAALAAHPALAALARAGAGAQWAALLALSFFGTAARVAAFTAVFIIVANAARPADRSRVNGLGQALVSVARALGPPAATPLYAWTLSGAGGARGPAAPAVWFALAAAALYAARVAQMLPPSAAVKRAA